MEKLILKAVTLLIAIIILTVGGYTMHGDYRIAEAIKNGEDPVLARLAFENNGEALTRAAYIGSMNTKNNQPIHSASR